MLTAVNASNRFAIVLWAAAHALSKHKLKRLLKRRSRRPVSDYQCDEMDECTDEYAAYAMEQIELARQNCKGSIVLIEQHLDYSAYVPEGFGTGDLVIVADGALTVIDFPLHRAGEEGFCVQVGREDSGELETSFERWGY